MKKCIKKTTLLLIAFAFFNCSSSTDDQPIDTTDDYIPLPTSPVEIDLSKIPYQKLSDYKLFEDNIAEMKPSIGVHPYTLSSQLFTDYASKSRWVWMPNNTKATFTEAKDILQFPEKTVLVKTFYYDRAGNESTKRILETRIMIKKGTLASGEGDWIFANYIWNDEQTEAYLDNNGRNVDITFTNEYNNTYTTTYRIPSETECMICHKDNEKAIPIGPKLANMNLNYSYKNGTQNQIDYWIANDLIATENLNRNIEYVIDWKNPNLALKDRMRSYLEINCAHCHAESKHCDYRPIRLGYYETTSEENMGVCVTPQDNIDSSLTAIITPQNIGRSVMHYRLSTTDDSYKMPLLGRSIVDEEAVALLEEYIASLIQPCN